MSVRFAVLGSGSQGNVAILQAHGFGILIDGGLEPKQITPRLEMLGLDWSAIHAMILTHTHRDHWKDRTLAELCRRGIPLYCHQDHFLAIQEWSTASVALQRSHRIVFFEEMKAFAIHDSIQLLPIRVLHDSDPTFAFRFTGSGSSSENSKANEWSLGFASDLGSSNPILLSEFQDLNLLALEFNYDREMQLRSKRSAYIKNRILSDQGHLSNTQAGEIVETILQNSHSRMLSFLVQLHLSQECNQPRIAREIARKKLSNQGGNFTELITATQDEPTFWMILKE